MPGGVLIDAGPDLRAQALKHRITRVDAIVFTHGHADHILGLDDVRRFNSIMGQSMKLYGDAVTLEEIRRTSAMYSTRTRPRGGLPQLDLTVIEGPFAVGELPFVPVPLWHGKRQILGLRIGRFAYLTDCNAILTRPGPSLQVWTWSCSTRSGIVRINAFLVEGGDCGRRPDCRAADLFHPHVPRPAARRDERKPAPGSRAGLRWPAAGRSSGGLSDHAGHPLPR